MMSVTTKTTLGFGVFLLTTLAAYFAVAALAIHDNRLRPVDDALVTLFGVLAGGMAICAFGTMLLYIVLSSRTRQPG